MKNHQIGNLNDDIKEYKDSIVEYQAAVGIWKNNARSYSLGLSQCNAGVQNTAETADRLNRAGVAALNEVKRAGNAVERKVQQIDALPAGSCEDALAILKAGGS